MTDKRYYKITISGEEYTFTNVEDIGNGKFMANAVDKNGKPAEYFSTLYLHEIENARISDKFPVPDKLYEYILKGFIVNASEYDNGNKETSGIWISFPAGKDEIKKALETIGLSENAEQGQYFFDDFKTDIHALMPLLNAYCDIENLQKAAVALDFLDSFNMLKLNAIMETDAKFDISDNENMYSFLYGEGWISTQKKMIDEGVFTDKDYAEFDELQRGVLAGLERTAIIRFDGVPFTYPDYERIEQNPKEWDYKSRDAEALAEELDNYFRKTDHNYAEVFPNADEKKMRLYDTLMEGHFIGIKNLLSDMGISESGYLQRRVTAHEINYPMDLYVVYQLKPDLGLENLHYQTISGIRSMGKTIDKENYTPVYSAELTYDKTFTNIVAELYYNRPSDFYGRPLNVSDVIVLQKNGQEQAFYYDIAGFVSIPEFLESRKKTEQIKEKPSIRKQLADNKAKAADIPKHTKQKNKDLEV